MQRLRSDTTENVLYLTLAGEVTAGDVNRLERDAVVAARVLDDEFVLVVDVSDCERVSGPATERVRLTVGQLAPFGLRKEVRVVADDTPDAVQQALRRPSDDCPVEVVRERSTSTEESNQSVDIGRC